MNRRTQTTKIFLIVLSLFIPGCIFVGPKTTADPATAIRETSMPPLAELATSTSPPTDAPTATVYPPVFNPETLGDNRELDSFILTRTLRTTGGGGEVEEHQDTIGYIKEPFNAYRLDAYSTSGWPGGVDVASVKKVYLIGDRFYTTNATVDWIVSLEAPPDEIDILQREADLREGYIDFWDVGPLSAQFVGQEDFQGIPANHFALDQTNFNGPDQTGTHKIETAQGDIYLAQDGNYLLYFHVKVTGNVDFSDGAYHPGVREVTEELSSINQLKEIAVPAEYLEPEQTLLDLDLPLPAGTTLVAMRRFGGTSWETYAFAASVSNDEFLEFYENLAPTSDWTVSHIGQVTNHYPCSDQDQVCVIINKGDVQFILDYSEGSITADYDRERVFSPQ